MSKDIWSNDYQLINIYDISDQEMKNRIWSGTLEFFMKHVHTRNMINKWLELAEILPKIIKENVGYNYIEMLLYYSLTKTDKNDRIKLENLLISHLNPKVSTKIMVSLAQAWKEEGIEIGKAQLAAKLAAQLAKERKNIAKKMLAKNKPLDEIIEFTSLSKVEIQKLQP